MSPRAREQDEAIMPGIGIGGIGGKVSLLASVARESIVLFTVIIVVVGCGIAWTQVVNPFMKSQAEITTKTAETLMSIKELADSVARTAEAQRIHSENLAKTAERLERASDRTGGR